jgi:transposase
VIVIEEVCKKYACCCTVKTTTKPLQPIGKSNAGTGLLTPVIVAKYADHPLGCGAVGPPPSGEDCC